MKYLKVILLVCLFAFTISPLPTSAIPVEACMEARCIDYFKKWQAVATTKGASAISALAELYYQGYGTKKNLNKSIQYFRQASRHKFAYAQYRAGAFYLMEEDFIDNEKGIKYLRKAAKNGHIESAYLLGVVFGTGELGIKDIGESDKWLGKALRNKHTVAQEYADYLYLSGQVDEDHYVKVNEIISEFKGAIPQGDISNEQGEKSEIQWSHNFKKEEVSLSELISSDSFGNQLTKTKLTSSAAIIDTEKPTYIQEGNCDKIFSCYDVDKEDFWRAANTQSGFTSK